jgi:hypothetical protein
LASTASQSQLPAQNNKPDAHPSAPSPLAHPSTSFNAPTPKPRSRRNIFPSSVSTQPEVRLQPPTPSSAGSQFTKIAKGLAREIEAEQSRWDIDVSSGNGAENSWRKANISKAKPERSPFGDIANQHTARRGSIKSPRVKMHLPDVTGLTSAVESPAKPTLKHYMYQDDDGPGESEGE